MASSGKDYQREIESLSRKEVKAAAELAEAKEAHREAAQMLDKIGEKKRNAIFAALDSIKKRYFHRLLGGRGVKVLAPKVSGVEEATLGMVTTIPKLVDQNLQEIEIAPIVQNYSYVRVLYNTMVNEYFYEVIEPKLMEEESDLLEVLKEILVENLELLEDAGRKERDTYLRRVVDGLLRELGVTLHPVSKERIMYYVLRDFIRFGAIDVVMIDKNVEDVSCDGVAIPFYI